MPFIVTGTVLSSTAVAADEGIGDPPFAGTRRSDKTPLTRSVGELVAFRPDEADPDHQARRRQPPRRGRRAAGQNLAEIAVGDFVVIRHGRAHVISLKKASGLRGATEVEEKEGGQQRQWRSAQSAKMSVVADLIAVDDRRGYLTAKGPNGNLIDA